MKFILIFMTLLLISCDNEGTNSNKNSYAGELIYIPTDSKANYEVLYLNHIDENTKVIATKRMGSSGLSFSKIKVNCSNKTFQYLGDGDTEDKMENGVARDDDLELVPQSIKWYQSNYACTE